MKIHDNKNHSKNMTSSWNGIWKQSSSDDDNDEEQDWKMIFKIEQSLMSYYKLKGYVRSLMVLLKRMKTKQHRYHKIVRAID